MKKIFPALILTLSLLLSGCGAASSTDTLDDTPQSTELYAMDTVMTLTAYGEHAQEGLDAASEEIQRLDSLFSISSESGDILPLNEKKSGTLSKDTASLLKRALEISKSTDGIFDCTIAPVMEAWGFPSGNYRVPGKEELSALLSHVDYRQVQLDGNSASLPQDVEIDLGGIAKGYTSNRVMEVFKDQGVTSGIISLGGNVQALGLKPDGSKWRVAIQNPNNAEDNFAVVEAQDEAIITSGGYQRYFDEGNVRYHHIIDPRTGYPANSGLSSVTIISKDGTLADGLSTSLFIMGLSDASAYWKAHSDEFDAVLMTDDGQVYITKGIEDRCSLLNGGTPQIIS